MFGRTLTLLLLLCSSCIQIGIAFSIASTFLQRSLRSPSNSEHKILPLAISSSSSYVSSLAMSVGDGANSNNNKGTIAVFGGTGLLGRECVYQALRSGRKVVVLARDPSKMLIPLGSGGSLGDSPLVDDKLTMLEGDVTEQSAVDTVFSSCSDIEGVIVSLGGKTRLNGPTMLEDGTRCIISAMKRLSPSTKRIAAITAVGCGDSENQAPFYYKALMYTVMKSVYKDKNKQVILITLHYTVYGSGDAMLRFPCFFQSLFYYFY